MNREEFNKLKELQETYEDIKLILAKGDVIVLNPSLRLDLDEIPTIIDDKVVQANKEIREELKRIGTKYEEEIKELLGEK